MKQQRKLAALTLLALLVGTCIMMAGQISAQSITKPSVPEFTINLVEHSYDVLPRYTIDPYTGNNITARVGYQVQNMSVELVIPNQPFTSYKDSNDTTINLFYNVSWKGYFETEWNSVSPHYLASNSSHTVLSFGIDIPEYASYPATKLGNFPVGSQLDFRIQTLIGYYKQESVHLIDPASPLIFREVFYGESSEWSNIHSVTINSSFISPSPTVPEFLFTVILPLLGVFPVVAIVLMRKKCKSNRM
jgi:hypothetical protein